MERPVLKVVPGSGAQPAIQRPSREAEYRTSTGSARTFCSPVPSG